jgi:hypothetical protein
MVVVSGKIMQSDFRFFQQNKAKADIGEVAGSCRPHVRFHDKRDIMRVQKLAYPRALKGRE